MDDVPPNQTTGSGKRDLKPQKRKIARKPRQKIWKQIQINETEKSEEENSEVCDFLSKHWSRNQTFSKRGPVQDVFNFYYNKQFQTTMNIILEQILQNQTNRFKINCSFGFLLRI